MQKRSVAMVYQAFINYPSFSVYDNIASPLKVAGLPKDEIDDRVQQFADLLQLTPMLQRLPDELSGGQQQRTALARALVKGADLVLLDEPLANLDYKLREELRDELPKMFADTGATVVYATSEPLEALMLGGYTATLNEGRVVQFGETSSIYRQPRSLEARTRILRSTDQYRHNRQARRQRLPERIGQLDSADSRSGIARWPLHHRPASAPPAARWQGGQSRWRGADRRNQRFRKHRAREHRGQ